MNNIVIMLLFAVSSFKNFYYTCKPILLFLIDQLLSMKLYYHTDKININYIMNHVKSGYAYEYDDKNEPNGWIVGYGYICYVNNDRHCPDLSIICRKEFHERILRPLLKTKNTKQSNLNSIKTNNITMLYRTGTYEWFQYKSRSMDLYTEIKENQKLIIDNIIKVYNKKHICTTYIHGDVGIGKTMTAYLLAKQLNGSICDTFNPSEPNDFLDNLYSRSNPTHDAPLIILMDEIDIMINNINKKKQIIHDKYPIQIYNKTTWNLFFDKISMGLYPYIIVVLCSNVSPHEINKKDFCYLRENRIQLIANMV